jgi:cell division transport system permease protein
MKRRGVRAVRPPLSRLFRAWLAQHAQACLFSLGETVRNPLGSVLTAAVIGISLALPAAFYTTLVNVRQVAGGWDAGTRISLFLKLDVDPGAAKALANKLRARPDVSTVKYISRAEALVRFRRGAGRAGGKPAAGAVVGAAAA